MRDLFAELSPEEHGTLQELPQRLVGKMHGGAVLG